MALLVSPKMRIIVALAAACLVLAAAGAAFPVPVNYAAGQDSKWSYGLAVMNYDAGAAFSESYSHAEHLQMDTSVHTRTSSPGACGGGVLEASINSNVIGQAHIAWISAGLDASGRRVEYGRSIEDLTGVFSIQKFIQLWDNSSPGEISVDWMPCL
ncbi:MAG: hypothetical protein GKC10_02285 [Methanosarcinales archaeon]|nr:hypothetical protein [Methanosarcinales archaeon]